MFALHLLSYLAGATAALFLVLSMGKQNSKQSLSWIRGNGSWKRASKNRKVNKH